MATAAVRGQNCVNLLYRKADKEKAQELEQALTRTSPNIKVVCHEDMEVDESTLTEYQLVVLIVTKNIVINNSLLNSIQTNRLKVVAVRYCDHSVYNYLFKKIEYGELRPLVLEGSKPADEIAARILEYMQDSKRCNDTMPRRVKTLMMVDLATKALMKYFDIDRKMKELHKTMTENVEKQLKEPKHQKHLEENPVQKCQSKECSSQCHLCVLWKRQLKRKANWNDGKLPKAFDKTAKPNIHIHHLHTEDQGHVTLASMFLTKRPKSMSRACDCSDISEYLDHDGILQLLKKCSVFNTDATTRDKIDKIHDARHLVAHQPVNAKTEDQEKLIHTIVKAVKDSLYGLLPCSKWEELTLQLEMIRKRDIQEDRQPATGLEKELVQIQTHKCSEEFLPMLDSLMRRLGKLEFTNPQGAGGPTVIVQGDLVLNKNVYNQPE